MSTRESIERAAVALVADDGLDGVSVRKVATRAGVSAGLVQHHYPTKQALLMAAMGSVDAVVAQRLATLPGQLSAGQRLRALAREILPLDAERAVEGRVWLAFVARAAVDPATAAAHTASWQQLEDAIAALLAGHRGHPSPEQDDRDRAALLLAGLDGLAVTAVSEPARLPPARTARLADRLLSDALGPG